MASGNGSWVNSGSYGMRLTWSTTQSPSSVSSGTSSVTVRLRVYVETKNAVSDSSNTFTLGGSWPSYSGSVSVSIPSGGGTELIYDETITVSTVYDSTVTKGFSASLTGINIIPGTATVSGSHTVGKRPVNTPAAPGTPTVSRTSDKSHTISVSRNATSAAPYASQQLQRRTWNATTGAWGSWVLITTNTTRYTSSGTTSFTDTSTVANRTYGYRVAAVNSTGSANSSASANVNTTPGVASSMAASRSGTDIVVTGSASPIQVNGAAVTYSWQDNPNQSGWVGVGGTTSSPNRTFTGVNTSQTHQYRTAASVSSGTTNATTLTGTYSAATGIVQLLSPPLAPTLVSPTGGVLERGVALNFSWIHNPVDSTPQRAYQVRYRYDGGAWNYLTASSNSEVIPFTPTGSSVTMEWGVRTKGQYTTSPTDNEYGPWSTTASVLLRARPTALITSPVDPWSQGRAVLAWSFSSADSAAQASWEASLWSDGVQVSTTRTGTTASTVTFNVELTQSTTYTVQLRVRDSNGLWSLVETQAFTVAFTPPLSVKLDTDWDTVQAAVQLTPEVEPFNLRSNFATNPKLTDPYGTITVPDVATNRWPRPQPVNSSGVIWGAGAAGQTGTSQYVTSPTDGPTLPDGTQASYGYFRYTCTTPKTSGSDGMQMLSNRASTPGALTTDRYTLTVAMRYTGSTAELRPRLRLQPYTSGGSGLTGRNSPEVSLPNDGQWHWYTWTPENFAEPFNSLGFWAYLTGVGAGQVIPAGGVWDITCISVQCEVFPELIPSPYIDGGMSVDSGGNVHGWTGTEWASVSYKRYPEAATGTAPAIRGLGNINAAASTGGGAIAYTDGSRAITDLRVSATTTTAIYPTGTAGTDGGSSMERMGLVVGKWCAIGVLYSQDAVLTGASPMGRCISGSRRIGGVSSAFTYGTVAPNEIQTDTPLTMAFLVEAGYQDWSFRLLTGAVKQNARTYWRNLIIAIGDTEDEALAKVQEWFDGDSVATSEYTYVWGGTPNRSISHQRRLGAGPDPVDSISIQRLSEDGREWVTIIDHVPPSSQYLDRLALLGDNTYRAVSWSSNMAVTEGTPVDISWVHDRCPVFVNGGDGYLLQGRALAQSVSSAPDKESTLYYWEDVRLPDAIYGIQTSETISVSASLRDGDGRATPARVWRELLYAGGDVCYRDCGESHGDFPRRVFGRLKVSSTSQGGSSSRTINFSIEQTGTTEGIQVEV